MPRPYSALSTRRWGLRVVLRLSGLIGLWLLCVVIALAGGWSVMWVLVYALGAVLVGSLAWAHLNVVGIEMRRRHRSTRLQVGDVLSEKAILELQPGVGYWWPRLWLEVRDGSTLPGHRLDHVVSLGPAGRRVWELRSTCTRRGRFTLGPVWVTSGDPFGLFHAERQVADETSLVVYPRTVDLPRFSRLPGELPGGALQGARVQFSTPNVSTVREYAPGDAFNRIHWATTARMGRLMVREFELDPSADVWLVMDLHRDVQAGEGDESTEEYTVTVTASLARHLLDRGRSVGLITQTATLPPDRGPRQLERMLEVLAVVRATSHLRLDVMLASETSRFARSATLIVVTPTTSESWVAYCQMLSGRGIRTAGVLIEAGTFGPAMPSLLLVSSLAAAHMPAYLVKRGQPLGEALATRHARPRAYGG